jgi:hypothetical protein
VTKLLVSHLDVTLRSNLNEPAPGVIVTTLHFLSNLRIGPKSFNVSADWSENACQGQTLQLFGPIGKLGRKRIVMKTVPGPYISAREY